ncbi:MAG: phosphoribosylformylglycinamidine synthase subunit PurQ [bacterium]
MIKVKVLIITGYGLNCENETEYAFNLANAEVEKVNLNDILPGIKKLEDYQILVFIGGFSFGDHIAAGVILANKFKNRLRESLDKFIRDGKLIIGICNGFQTIVRLGLLPGFDLNYTRQSVTLIHNDSGKFEDRWVQLRVNPESPCIFTRGMNYVYLPVRHGEGKFYSDDNNVIERILGENLIALQYSLPADGYPTMVYPHNPNGSLESIAGICDPSGRIFGLMPHPEGFLSPYNHPYWTRLKVENCLPKEGEGARFFRNAVNFFK